MNGFDEIIGHEEIKKHLTDAISSKKVSHAYIFDGEDGCGKRMMATAFVKTLLCEKGGTSPCNECTSCKQMDSSNNPDVRWVTHAKPGIISVDEIREQLVSDTLIKPYAAERKVYIIDEAQYLNVAAQNAMLKTIEEPPAYVTIIMLTNNSEMFLQTILSRCVTLKFKPVDNELVADHIIKQCHMPEYQARLCAHFSGGNVGKALLLANGGEIAGIREEVLGILKYSDQMNISELISAVKTSSKYKVTPYEYIDFFLMWYRDILMYKATMDPNRIMYKSEINSIIEQSKIISYEGLEKIIEALEKAKKRLKANVNFETTMELMFLVIKERGKE